MAVERNKTLNVIVVGGSLGGLFTAIVLKRLGHHIRILERTPTVLLHSQGAGIVLGGPALDFFHRHDRTRSSLAVTSSLRQYLNKRGDVINEEAWEQQMTSWDLLYNVLRRNFDGGGDDAYFSHIDEAILEEASDSTGVDGTAEYLYGHKVTSLKEIGSHWVEVAFTDQEGKEGSLQADLVIGADGPNSTVRKILLPDVERTYAGYVAWRGTVLESELDDKTFKILAEKFTFFHSDGLQMLAYLIPGANGTLAPDHRLLNYVWYDNYTADSPAFHDLMTDSHGTRHHYTLPAGTLSSTVWTAQQHKATARLPPQFAELVLKTTRPLVQVITDMLAPRSVFMGGKLVLVGDAMAGFRPHTAASTTQAAMHALLLGDVVRGQMELGEWEDHVVRWAKWMAGRGVAMGERSQFQKHPLAD